MDREAGLRVKEQLGSRATYHIVPQSGHHIYADNYEFFNERIQEAKAQAEIFKKASEK
jgi:hypothetical protein